MIFFSFRKVLDTRPDFLNLYVDLHMRVVTQLCHRFGEAMKRLSERERSIISMRFFRGKTQMEIADEIGISQAQVSRIEKGALDRVRKQI